MEENIMVQEEFTFKKFFGLLKKSAKRILIFGLIAAVIGVCLSAIVGISLVDKKVYSAMIEYTHSGVEKGLAPNGTALNYAEIKSAAVVNGALKEMGYSDAEISSLSGSVQDCISIAPYISSAVTERMKQDTNFVYYPTRFTISVENKSIKGLKTSRYAELINKVIESYQKYFKTVYNYEVKISDTVGESAIAGLDYYDTVVIYRDQLNLMKAELNYIPSAYASLASKLVTRVNVLENHLNSIENYILTNNVLKEGEILTLKANLTNRYNDNKAKSDSYGHQLTEYSATIDSYNQMFESVIVGNGSSTITVSAADAAAVYNDLVLKKESIIALKAECDKNIAVLEKKIEMHQPYESVVCTKANRTYVEEKFISLHNDYVAAINYMNEELADFTTLYVVNSGVKIISHAGSSSSISWIAVAVVFLLCVLVGVIAAVVVTSVKEKKTEQNN